jgi:hypothetical protein
MGKTENSISIDFIQFIRRKSASSCVRTCTHNFNHNGDLRGEATSWRLQPIRNHFPAPSHVTHHIPDMTVGKEDLTVDRVGSNTGDNRQLILQYLILRSYNFQPPRNLVISVLGLLYPPYMETIGSVVGRKSGSRSSDRGGGNGRVRLKQGVYFTQRLMYILMNRYRVPEANGDGRLLTEQCDAEYSSWLIWERLKTACGPVFILVLWQGTSSRELLLFSTLLCHRFSFSYSSRNLTDLCLDLPLGPLHMHGCMSPRVGADTSTLTSATGFQSKVFSYCWQWTSYTSSFLYSRCHKFLRNLAPPLSGWQESVNWERQP